ncbi:hypothetical protein L7F22_043382 [Adiantum nelumboides]|nr:hypothetical protein [Adiantum nelumboides]
MELLSAIDNSPLWSFASQGDANYQAEAMEAILSQASLGLMSTSEYQAMAHYGLLKHPLASILEGMDETQVNGVSSNSATSASSLGLDHKPHNNIYSKQLTKINNMMLSCTHDPSKAQVAMCAKRRSWQEALSSPPRANHCISDSIDSSNENCPRVIYPVNDGKASIASLAYPCTLVERHEGKELPHINQSVGKAPAAYMKPMLGDKEAVEGSARWQEILQISSRERQFSKSRNVEVESTRDVRSMHENMSALISAGPLYGGIDESCNLSLYKEEALMHQHHHIDKEATIASMAIQQPSSANQYVSKKRPAAVAHLPSSSASSHSKRAHLQNMRVVNTAAASAMTTTTTTSTTTKSSKSSSRNPQGPALNTNGKPRAVQGSANDPQSIAARNRRERINARLKVLQELVPNGSKVDLVTMLEKAINYVKYLQLQLRVLSNDDLWQASQDNLSEKGAANAGSEEDYNMNESLNNVACSDTSETHNSTHMGDKEYKP